MTRRIGEIALTNAERSWRYDEKNRGKRNQAAADRYWANRDEIRAKAKQKRIDNRPAVEAAAALRKANRVLKGTDVEKHRRNSLAWKKANPEACKEHAKRRLASPQGKLHNRIRAGIHNVLRKGKGGKTTANLVGWTISELRAHLEKQFLGGMSWANMGDWHIDHIVPLASFSISDHADPELRRAWALSNLRPLWAKENMSKGAKKLTLL